MHRVRCHDKGLSPAEPHYFSERLMRKLDMMRSASAFIVEAPSGYGKTTAVRDYLEISAKNGAYAHWFTAADEAPEAAFRRLCREIEKIDSRAGERLLKIDFPNAFTIGEACDALRHLGCDRDVWLVLDNFQLLYSILPPVFLTALIEHETPGLHVVVITQKLSRDMQAAIAGRGFPHITSSDMRLEADDISRYYALTGAGITQEGAQKVMDYTDGWIIAVYLQLCSFRETGAFSDTALLTLMEKLVWDKLTSEQQTFLLRLSPFETTTARHACSLLGCSVLPDYAADALSGPFIHYDPVQRRYEPHNTFRELVLKKRLERGQAFERDCLLLTGDICRDEGRTGEALAFYFEVKAYGRILSLNLSHVIFEEIWNASFFEVALDIAKHCPMETRLEFPLSMLRVAWALKASGADKFFADLMNELDKQLGDDGLLRAEWLLLSAYMHYPSFDAMIPPLQRAALLFEGRFSQVILPEAPWAFGGYFQMTEFHIKAGEADREALLFENFIALYSSLTNGHGSGADALFMAEIAYLRGDMVNAEIFAYKAAFLADSKQQSIVRLGAGLMLANIALVKADTAGWQRAISSMERVTAYSNQNTSLVRTVLDTVRGTLLVELGAETRIAEWLKNLEPPSHLMSPMAINSLYVHLVFLMYQGNFACLIGTLEAMLREIGGKSVYAEFSMLFLLAASYALTGESDKAAAIFEDAAEKSMPDGFIIHLASYVRLFPEHIEKLFREKYPASIDTFNAIKARFCSGWESLHSAVSKDELPLDLTAREREIALLAAGGLRNKEIAVKLFVTESTVRTHLRTIFQKLDIDRRAKLADKLK